MDKKEPRLFVKHVGMDRRHLDAVLAKGPDQRVNLFGRDHKVACYRCLAPPVGWKLIAIAVPMAGGTDMPSSVIGSLRGTEN